MNTTEHIPFEPTLKPPTKALLTYINKNVFLHLLFE